MATYDVSSENGRTVIRKRHPVLRPFWNGVSIAFALVLLYASIATARWLIVPALAIVGLALMRRQQPNARRDAARG